MKEYKLIKEYPGNPYNLGDIISKENDSYRGKGAFKPFIARQYVENYPEFWEEVVKKDYGNH